MEAYYLFYFILVSCTHQENNTLLGWLETLESTRVARNTRSSSKFLKKKSPAL